MITVSDQYRVPCEECGKPDIDHLRMHSRVSPEYVKKKLNDDPRNRPESVSGTWVECNLCGNLRVVQ